MCDTSNVILSDHKTMRLMSYIFCCSFAAMDDQRLIYPRKALLKISDGVGSNVLATCCNMLAVCSNVLTVCINVLTVCSNVLAVCSNVLTVCRSLSQDTTGNLEHNHATRCFRDCPVEILPGNLSGNLKNH